VDTNVASNLTTDSHVEGAAFDIGKIYFSSEDGKFDPNPTSGGFPMFRVTPTGQGARLLSQPYRIGV
jgi:hypothetical protein